MTPRLAVTQEQAKSIHVGVGGLGASRCVLRLPERPTTPCHRLLHLTSATTTAERYTSCRSCDGRGRIPIPEGTRAEVGWVGFDLSDPHTRIDADWHPVATATLAKWHGIYLGSEVQGYVVTLTDIEPVEAQP